MGMKHKKIKGIMKTLKVTLYKDHPIYIRMIGKDIFEYLLIHNNEIYTSYIVMNPEEGKKKLTRKQINMSADLIYTGAEATIDALLGEGLEDREAAIDKAFEIMGEKDGEKGKK